MREFTTALAEKVEKEEGAEPLDFKLDGKEYKVWKPLPSQVAMLVTSMGKRKHDTDKVAGIVDFLMAVLDEEGAANISERLLDRNDPFGLDQVQDIIEWLIEEWTGRPTQRPAVSTS